MTKQASHLREGFKNLSAMPRSQANSSTPSIYHYHHLREELEIRLEFICSFASFVNAPDTSATEPSKTYFVLWRGHCRYLRIKDLTLTARSLRKYAWKVILCKVLTERRCLGPDIWLETADQAQRTKNMMRKI